MRCFLFKRWYRVLLQLYMPSVFKKKCTGAGTPILQRDKAFVRLVLRETPLQNSRLFLKLVPNPIGHITRPHVLQKMRDPCTYIDHWVTLSSFCDGCHMQLNCTLYKIHIWLPRNHI